MKKNVATALVLKLLILSSFPSRIQALEPEANRPRPVLRDIAFEHLTVKDGLSDNTVAAVSQVDHQLPGNFNINLRTKR